MKETHSRLFHLYVHIPFCRQICIYCNFCVTTARKHFDRYTAALLREITHYAESYRDFEIATIYFGGGTPSYLPADLIEQILSAIYNSLRVADDAEITLEANPDDLKAATLTTARKLGFNRLSVGVQSFDDEELKFLTRTHNGHAACEAIRAAKRTGFNNISLDLMFGLPDQSLARWELNLQTAVDLAPTHISVYNLTVEEKTHLYKMVASGSISLENDERDYEMFMRAHALLQEAGYEHYEVSNYGRPDLESRHNRAYWLGRHYLGLGVSAHSFDGDARWWNTSNLEEYMQLTEEGRRPTREREQLSREAKLIEQIQLGFRTSRGLSMAAMENLSGQEFLKTFSTALEKARQYIEIKEGHCRLTPQGMFLYNTICGLFVADL